MSVPKRGTQEVATTAAAASYGPDGSEQSGVDALLYGRQLDP